MPSPRRRRNERPSILDSYSRDLGQIALHRKAELAFLRGVELRRADTLMRNVFENSFDGIITAQADGHIVMANDAALTIFERRREELEQLTVQSLIPEMQRKLDEAIAGRESARGHFEAQGFCAEGKVIPLDVALSVTREAGSDESLVIAVVRDIRDLKEQQAKLQHQALHDALTNLPNRSLLTNRLDHAIDFARREEKPLALLLLDLDRFKEINDTLGHHVGDLLLTEVAHRLQTPVRRTDTIARLGGDEFAALLPAVTDLERAYRVARRIAKAMEAPFDVVEGLSLEVGVSIGIAMFPDHADNGARLMQCSDVAMYAAKRNQTTIALYDQGKDINSVRHLALTGELRHAIENDHLQFHYQPKIDLATRRLVAVEALARWTHPEHGAIPPDEFVAQAERTGLIRPLARWCFDTALSQLVAWAAAGHDIGIAVNLSARNLHEESLPDLLRELIEERGVDPHKLTLEITESAIMVDPESARSVVHRLVDIGVRLSIDDFGTGYSSLAYLKRLPVEELKIDQSFVFNMTENEHDPVIVRSTIDLAHNLGLTVVAEGIESERHIALLAGLGCNIGQGYFIGEPMPIDKMETWFRNSPWTDHERIGEGLAGGQQYLVNKLEQSSN